MSSTPLLNPMRLGGPRGPSGKIIVIYSPEKKVELYDALEKEGLTMRGWIAKNAWDQFGIRLK